MRTEQESCNRSNCTFMELKFNMMKDEETIKCSNCTFMELK